MTFKLPKIIGHRGAAAYAPENTAVGIHSAADLGVDWVELDVKLTKDFIPIIFHDSTLERTTNGFGQVQDHTWSEIQELDAGSWFSESFTGEGILSLERAIDIMIERNLGFNLEIKPCEGREVETAEVALDMISSIWDEQNSLLISSFATECLETSKNMALDIYRGLLVDGLPDNWLELAKDLDVKSINLNGNNVSLTKDDIHTITETGHQIMAYTINDASHANTLMSWGVSSFCSDQPDILIEDMFSVH